MLSTEACRRVWSEFTFENPKAMIEKSESVVTRYKTVGRQIVFRLDYQPLASCDRLSQFWYEVSGGVTLQLVQGISSEDIQHVFVGGCAVYKPEKRMGDAGAQILLRKSAFFLSWDFRGHVSVCVRTSQ
jgi:hypothetical protein